MVTRILLTLLLTTPAILWWIEAIHIHQLEVPAFAKNQPLPLKERYIKSSSFVKTRVECFSSCFFLDGGEVSQLEETGSAILNCSCTSLTARNLLMFTARYLQTDSRRVQIHYVEPASMGLFAVEMKPALFYALDNVSGGRNLGSLDPDKYSVNFGSVAPRFDTQFFANRSNKFLRLVPTEKPFYFISVNKTISMKDITAMSWFKKLDLSSSSGPILEASDAAFSHTWYMWNYDTSTKLTMCFYVGCPETCKDMSYDMPSWNHMVIRSVVSIGQMLVNGTVVVTESYDATAAVFGEHLQIGRRVASGSFLDGAVWPGALAHVAVFLRSASDEEIKAYADLIKDEDF